MHLVRLWSQFMVARCILPHMLKFSVNKTDLGRYENKEDDSQVYPTAYSLHTMRPTHIAVDMQQSGTPAHLSTAVVGTGLYIPGLAGYCAAKLRGTSDVAACSTWGALPVYRRTRAWLCPTRAAGSELSRSSSDVGGPWCHANCDEKSCNPKPGRVGARVHFRQLPVDCRSCMMSVSASHTH